MCFTLFLCFCSYFGVFINLALTAFVTCSVLFIFGFLCDFLKFKVVLNPLHIIVLSFAKKLHLIMVITVRSLVLSKGHPSCLRIKSA